MLDKKPTTHDPETQLQHASITDMLQELRARGIPTVIINERAEKTSDVHRIIEVRYNGSYVQALGLLESAKFQVTSQQGLLVIQRQIDELLHWRDQCLGVVEEEEEEEDDESTDDDEIG